MEPIIRKIQRGDNESLARIIRSCFHDFEVKDKEGTVYTDPTTDDLYALFQREGSILFVAEKDGNVVGCCGIFPTENLPKGYAELVKFYVSREARGSGLGKFLLEKSINAAKDLGYTHIYLESLPEFGKAVSIYEKLGFTYLQKPLGTSGHHGCNLWMTREV